MLIATALERIFLFENKGQQISLADPDRSMNAQAVLNFYAATYPILVTAKVSAPEIRNDKVHYRFETLMGTKG